MKYLTPDIGIGTEVERKNDTTGEILKHGKIKGWKLSDKLYWFIQWEDLTMEYVDDKTVNRNGGADET